ncbi:MAG: hypothetical protein OXH75_14720 [Acidobacteria bacterium]|nr:hypothetical protein [Acidobacteriota bacterium]
MEFEFIPAVAFFALIGFIFWVQNRTRLGVATHRAQIANKLLDNLGSGQEAMAFLESESGRTLLDAVSSDRQNPYGQVLRALTTGTILCAAGIGLLLLYTALPYGDVALGFGILALALGLGFVVAAGISYRLSKSWGLLDRTPGTSG